MEGAHAGEGERTLQGHSIGWWEGETLVVDTVDFAVHRSPYGSGTGIPLGTEKHVVERYRLSDDGTHAFVDIVLEDSEYLAEPVTAKSRCVLLSRSSAVTARSGGL
jgi:hypothetical protein